MPKKKDWEPKDHQVTMAALAYIRCQCGWFFKNEKLRHKTDEDLALECGMEFTRHQNGMETLKNTEGE